MMQLRVGQELFGFCEGNFGRDSYDPKRVEAIGADWVVARENGRPVFRAGNPDDLVKYAEPDCPACGARPLQVPCVTCGYEP